MPLVLVIEMNAENTRIVDAEKPTKAGDRNSPHQLTSSRVARVFAALGIAVGILAISAYAGVPLPCDEFGEVCRSDNIIGLVGDTAGGTTENYFLIDQGAAVDRRAALVQGETIGDSLGVFPTPSLNFTGLGHDGQDLWALDDEGIWKHNGGSDWGVGGGAGPTMYLGLSNALGLAVSGDAFYVGDSDQSSYATIKKFDKLSGQLLNEWPEFVNIGGPHGIGYMPATNELIVVNGDESTPNVLRFPLDSDGDIQYDGPNLEFASVPISGDINGTNARFVGIGYNHLNGKLVLNQNDTFGEYAFGVDPTTSIPTMSEWGMIATTLSLLAAGTVILKRRQEKLLQILE